MERKELIVSGFIQGVGFRYHVNMKALKFRVTGYVRNLDDGRVLIEVQGEAPSFSSFINDLPNGLVYARIEGMEVKDLPILEDEVKFKVRY